ncbi:MAG: thiamine-binding protein [Candidatus Kapabacteria bacterium]|nr:thiamine-binding protein [Candidatus Kapabacteria bacterium]MDW7996351.1 YkoF family thiamine/hydroxymethylpyrimidine-binding protein [Bacteroidota bacterium]MDW8225706.1 YkoF family thiamine/hydroxymethylpyrimidine-binding protein [Bacteroidota bacterium]
MNVAVTVAVYPLRQTDYQAIEAAIDALRSCGLLVEVQPMHTELSGPIEDVFLALRRAFEAAAHYGITVMTLTLTNACLPQAR